MSELTEDRIRELAREEIQRAREELAKDMFVATAKLYGAPETTEELGRVFEEGVCQWHSRQG